MLGFLKKVFLTGSAFLSTLTSVNPLECVSMSNQECKGRPKVVNVNSDGPIFYLFSIKKVNTVVALTISAVSMQSWVLLMLLTTQVSTYSM